MRTAEHRSAPASPRDATALVLCGGGGHGALEVGFAQALEDRGMTYDRILGTSIGALNGAHLAGGMSPADLAKLWKKARLWRLIRPNIGWILHPRALPGLLSLSGLARLLRCSLPACRFEGLKTPLTIVTTDLVTAKACYWEDEGDISRCCATFVAASRAARFFAVDDCPMGGPPFPVSHGKKIKGTA